MKTCQVPFAACLSVGDQDMTKLVFPSAGRDLVKKIRLRGDNGLNFNSSVSVGHVQ